MLTVVGVVRSSVAMSHGKIFYLVMYTDYFYYFACVYLGIRTYARTYVRRTHGGHAARGHDPNQFIYKYVCNLVWVDA